MLTFLMVFFCGAAYECCCVFWVRNAERGKTLPAVGFSMGAALVTALGVEGFLKNRVFLIAYVLGYGAGTAAGIQISRLLAAGAADGRSKPDASTSA